MHLVAKVDHSSMFSWAMSSIEVSSIESWNSIRVCMLCAVKAIHNSLASLSQRSFPCKVPLLMIILSQIVPPVC